MKPIKHEPNEDEISNLNTTTGYNELANPQNRKLHTISKYNTDDKEIENIERPETSIFKNLQIDTSKLFGIWVQHPNEYHADFWLTAKSFYVVDYDGNGDMPYKIEGNQITIFYNDFIQEGEIISTKQNELIIKWKEMNNPTKYIPFED